MVLISTHLPSLINVQFLNHGDSFLSKFCSLRFGTITWSAPSSDSTVSIRRQSVNVYVLVAYLLVELSVKIAQIKSRGNYVGVVTC